ncbi:MAG: polyprenyl synthetase family protein [Desulfurococcales archaeon]|nr:polyprenyl synthetase family protein [Desulfurococcales archaeon]
MDVMRGLIEKYVPIIKSELDKIARGFPENVYIAARHLLLAGGKRVRPALTLTYARMLGGEDGEVKALPFAVSVELVHNFTLIHDDIMDKDEYRRGVKTVHTVFGENMAILAGDLLFAISFENALGNENVQPENKVKAVHLLSQASRIVAEGQALDVSFEDRWDVTLEDYLDMIHRKTGALIEAATGMGALAVTQDDYIVMDARTYGKNVGIAFQLRDDILGIFGDLSITGKPVYNDISRAKKTVLVLYALSHLNFDESKRLKEILESKTSNIELLKEAASLIEKSGAKEYALNLAYRFSKEAVEIVEKSNAIDEDARKALIEFAKFVVEREK